MAKGRRSRNGAPLQKHAELCLLAPGALLTTAEVPHLATLPPGLFEAAAEELMRHRAHNACRDHLAYSLARGCYEIVFLVNGYRAGDYIRQHSDDEEQLLVGAPIMSYSFGRPVTFSVKQKSGQHYHIRTRDGLRLTMEGDNFQRRFTHGVAKRKRDPPNSYRICVTARLSEKRGGDTYRFSSTAAEKLPIEAAQIFGEAPPRKPLLALVSACACDCLPALDAYLREQQQTPGRSRVRRRVGKTRRRRQRKR